MSRHDHTTCRECQARPRISSGRWLCEPCEDRMFGTPAAPASADETQAEMRIEAVAA